MKYIRTKKLGIILFPAKNLFGSSHKEMADAVLVKSDKLISAGFVNCIDHKFNCYGFSQSLNLPSIVVEDSAILNDMVKQCTI